LLDQRSNEDIAKDKFYFYGLLAASVTASIAIVSKEDYSDALIVAACSFAVAIPALSLVALSTNFSEESGYGITVPWFLCIVAAGQLSSSIGFVALFWSVSWWAGVIAASSAILFVICFLRLDALVREQRKKQD
jgi:hypothetical protein